MAICEELCDHSPDYGWKKCEGYVKSMQILNKYCLLQNGNQIHEWNVCTLTNIKNTTWCYL